jgi:hypothetical protein
MFPAFEKNVVMHGKEGLLGSMGIRIKGIQSGL